MIPSRRSWPVILTGLIGEFGSEQNDLHGSLGCDMNGLHVHWRPDAGASMQKLMQCPCVSADKIGARTTHKLS